MTSALGAARVAGDPELLERMVVNLISNAERHNVPTAGCTWRPRTGRGCVVLEVANSGPVVPPDQVAGLLEPFRTLGPARTATADSGSACRSSPRSPGPTGARWLCTPARRAAWTCG